MGIATVRLYAWLFGVTLCIVATCGAQSSDSVAVGARVRVILRDSLRQWTFAPRTQTLIGTVVTRNADTLTLTIGAADTARVSRPQVRGLAVSRGTSRLRSAIAQAAFGALVGSVLSDRAWPRWANVGVAGGLARAIRTLASRALVKGTMVAPGFCRTPVAADKVARGPCAV